MEENRVLKGFLIPFCIAAAIVITAIALANTTVYRPLEDTSGYGIFTEAGYSSELLGFTLRNDGNWLYLNSDGVYEQMSLAQKSSAGQTRNVYGTEKLLAYIRPFISVNVQVSSKLIWSAENLSRDAFEAEELPFYAETFAGRGYKITDAYCRELQKDGQPMFYFVIEYMDRENACAYSETRFNSQLGAVELLSECKNNAHLYELITLIEGVAEPLPPTDYRL